MPQKTRTIGILLILTGITGYLVSGAASITALIPAFFGVVFILLAWLAGRESMRKHVMHAAVLLALIGLFGSIGGVADLFSGLFGQGQMATAALFQTLMALICFIYIVFGIKSFIDARKATE